MDTPVAISVIDLASWLGSLWGVWGGSSACLFWRDREADEHFEGAVEILKDVITGQASILAFGPLTGGYDDAAIPCAAFGTDNIGFPHGRNMRSDPGVFQSENLPQSN